MIRFALLLLISLLPLAAQTSLGTITGTVTDASGAPVPNVELVARATSTGLTYKGSTNDSGVYVIPNLPIGDFNVTAQGAGFKQVQRNGVGVEVAQRLRIDFALEAVLRIFL